MILAFIHNHLMKTLPLHNVDILEKFEKDWALNQKYIALKDDFEILRGPYLTFNDLRYKICVFIISIKIVS